MDVSKTIVGTNEIENGAVVNAKIADATIHPDKLSTTQIPITKLSQPIPGNGAGSSTTVNNGAGWQTVCSYIGSSFWNARRLLVWVQCGSAGFTCSTSVIGSALVYGRLVVDGNVIAERLMTNGVSNFDPHLMGSISLGTPGAKTVTFQVLVSGGTSATINNVAISSLQF